MNKEKYFRTLIFTGNMDDIYKVLAMIPEWKYSKRYEGGIEQDCIENKDKNVQVFFKKGIGFQSVNVLPIDPSNDLYDVYEEGYDASENQKSNLQEDILYSLCLQINCVIREHNQNNADNSIDVLCGIVPGIYDCEQV